MSETSIGREILSDAREEQLQALRAGFSTLALDDVLDEFKNELLRAAKKFPDCIYLPDGTGGGGRLTWERLAKNSCDRAYREGRLTHTHVLDEEAAEAMASEDTADLRKELVQTAAMCLKWILDIDTRPGSVRP